MKTKTLLIWTLALFLLVGCAQQSPEQQATQESEQVPTETIAPTPQPTPAAPSEPVPAPETSAQTPAPADTSSAEPQPSPTEEESQPQNTTSATSERCKDTDVTETHPDGINFGVQGNITINGKRLINGGDYCPNIVTISEWYCNGNAARVKTQKCPSDARCSQGVCG